MAGLLHHTVCFTTLDNTCVLFFPHFFETSSSPPPPLLLCKKAIFPMCFCDNRRRHAVLRGYMRMLRDWQLQRRAVVQQNFAIGSPFLF